MKPRSPYRLTAVLRSVCAVTLISVALAQASSARHAVDRNGTPIPCPKLDKSDPGCIAPNPEERAKVGSVCEVHPKSRLRLDVVPLSFGIISFEPGGPDARKQYPNAHVVYSMGCVVGTARWGEVAYCPECRTAFYWHNPKYILHPIQPLTVERREK